MKRNGLFSSLAGYCLVGICAGSLLATAAETRTGQIKGIFAAGSHGRPLVAEAGKPSVTVNGNPAKVGQTVGGSETITTSDEAVAEIYLGSNGPSLAVLAGSSVTIDELTADLNGSAPIITTRLSVKGGAAAGYVKKTSPQSVYTISTPAVTAAIKGTKWKVYADGRVYVYKGCVTVTSSTGGKFDVCAGQYFDPATQSVLPIPEGDEEPEFYSLPDELSGGGSTIFVPPANYTPTSPTTRR